MDETDIALIEMLQRDGRVTNKALARAVGLSESACLERVRKLEEAGVIRGYAAHVCMESVGVHFEAWVAVRLAEKTTDQMRALAAALDELPFALAAYEMAGPCDLFVHVIARDLDDWERAEEVLERAFGPGVSMRTAIVVRTLKSPSSPDVRALRAPLAERP